MCLFPDFLPSDCLFLPLSKILGWYLKKCLDIVAVVNKYLVDNQWVNQPATAFCGFVSIKGKKKI